MSRSFLDDFYEYLLKRGRRDKRTGKPSYPLSPTTAEKMLVMARRILVDRGIVGVQCRPCQRRLCKFRCPECGEDYYRDGGKSKRVYFVRTDYRRTIRPSLLTDWFDQEFPPSKVHLNPRDRDRMAGRKAQYIRAAYKLAEFLHFEKSVWTGEEVDELRATLGIESEWMFVKTSSTNPRYFGTRWSEDSGGFNDMIRKRAAEFGFSNEEVRLVSTHKIGRHAYGTWFVKHVDPETLRQNMRHADLKTTEKYLNWSVAARIRNTEQALLDAQTRSLPHDGDQTEVHRKY